jgi:hypothetical protein
MGPVAAKLLKELGGAKRGKVIDLRAARDARELMQSLRADPETDGERSRSSHGCERGSSRRSQP